MKKALPALCLLGALLVAGTGHAKEDESAAAEVRVTHLLRGMAHPSKAIIEEARARYLKAPDDAKRKPLEAMLALPVKKALRSFCANELKRLADKRSLPVLAKCSVRDEHKDVRAAAVEALRALKSPRTTRVLSQALRSRRTSDRVRATQALGALGDVNAAPYILCRWVARSGDFPRGYFAQTNQLSYVADFDVEVA